VLVLEEVADEGVQDDQEDDAHQQQRELLDVHLNTV
jgi:hypothetical protein